MLRVLKVPSNQLMEMKHVLFARQTPIQSLLVQHLAILVCNVALILSPMQGQRLALVTLGMKLKEMIVLLALLENSKLLPVTRHFVLLAVLVNLRWWVLRLVIRFRLIALLDRNREAAFVLLVPREPTNKPLEIPVAPVVVRINTHFQVHMVA